MLYVAFRGRAPNGGKFAPVRTGNRYRYLAAKDYLTVTLWEGSGWGSPKIRVAAVEQSFFLANATDIETDCCSTGTFHRYAVAGTLLSGAVAGAPARCPVFLTVSPGCRAVFNAAVRLSAAEICVATVQQVLSWCPH